MAFTSSFFLEQNPFCYGKLCVDTKKKLKIDEACAETSTSSPNMSMIQVKLEKSLRRELKSSEFTL